MSENKRITIEGYTAEELLNLPEEQIDPFVLCNQPVAFRVGSAEILRQFKVNNDRMIVELAHIDSGGERVLPTIWMVAERYASKKQLKTVERIVHAVHCAKANLKLRRILELKGFKVNSIAGIEDAYWYVQKASQGLSNNRVQWSAAGEFLIVA